MDAYDPPNVLVGTPQRERLVSLGALRAGQASRPQPGEIRVFFSVGLAGTEAFLLDRLATRIAYLSQCRIQTYKGNYSAFVQQRDYSRRQAFGIMPDAY